MPTAQLLSLALVGLAFAGCGGDGAPRPRPSVSGRILFDGAPYPTTSTQVWYDGLKTVLPPFQVGADGTFTLGSELPFMTPGRRLVLSVFGSGGAFDHTDFAVQLGDGPIELPPIDVSRKGFAITSPADDATCALPCTFSWSAYGGPPEASAALELAYFYTLGYSYGVPAGGTSLTVNTAPHGTAEGYHWTVWFRYDAGAASVVQGDDRRFVTFVP